MLWSGIPFQSTIICPLKLPDVGDDSGMTFENEAYVGSDRDDGFVDWSIESASESMLGGAETYESWRLRALNIVKDSDEAVRKLISLNCSIGDRELPSSAGWMNAIIYETPWVQIGFPRREYSFYLRLELDDEIYRTNTITSNYSASEIEDIIRWALPNASDYNLDIYVVKSDNLALIAELERKNDRIRKRFPYLSSAPTSSSSSSSWDTDAGSYEGPTHRRRRRSHHSDSSLDSNWPHDNSASFNRADDDDQLGPDAGGGPFHHHHHHEFGQHSPKLYDVPIPTYTVSIEFRNVSIAPEVWGVYSDDGIWDYTVSNRGQTAKLQAISLQVSSFEYVPPPSGLDLGGSTSTCDECYELAQVCLEDEDCRFGLKEYLVSALGKIKGDSNSSGLDVTYIFRAAQSHFPYNGYIKMSKVLTCLATRSPPCDLDYPREQRSKIDGSISIAPPTHFVIEPATAEFQIEMKSITQFYTNNGWVYNYNENGDNSAFEDFVAMVLGLSRGEFEARGGSMLSYNVSFFGDESNEGSGSWVSGNEVQTGFWNEDSSSSNSGPDGNVRYQELVQHWVSLGQAIQDFPTIEGAYRVTNTPWSVSLIAERPQDHNITDGYDQLEWRRLREWIDLLWNNLYSSNTNDDNSGGGSANSASSSTDTGEWSNHSTVIPATGNDICPECQAHLKACVTDELCRRGARTTVLPSIAELLSTVIDGDNETDPVDVVVNISGAWDVWMANFESKHSANRFTQFFSCLIEWGCALGYSNGSGTKGSKRIPTLMTLTAETTAKFKSSAQVKLEIAGTGSPQDHVDDWGASLVNRIEVLVRDYYSNRLSIQGYQINLPDGNVDHRILYHDLLIRYPDVKDSKGRVISSTEFSLLVRAKAVTVDEVISGVLEWFDMPESDYNATSPFKRWDVCINCEEAFQHCMEDQDCHEVAVYAFADSLLIPSVGFENKYVTFDGSFGSEVNNYYSYNYYGDIKNILNSVTWKSENSRLLFIEMFRCLASVGCDVSYMTNAAAAPATPHEPTTLKFTPTTINLFTYPGTRIAITLNGQEMVYTRSTDIRKYNDPSHFSSWLHDSCLSMAGVNITVLSEGNFEKGGQYYAFEFGNFEPSIKLVKTDNRFEDSNYYGDKWRMEMKTVDVVPTWAKLIDLLKIAAESTPIMNETGYSCPRCQATRDLCLVSDFCRYALNMGLLSWLRSPTPSYGDGGYYEVDFTDKITATIAERDMFEFSTDWPVNPLDIFDLISCTSKSGPGATCVTESSNLGAGGALAELVADSTHSDIAVPLGATLYVRGKGKWGPVRWASYKYDGNTEQLAKTFAPALEAVVCLKVSVELIATDEMHHLRVFYHGFTGNLLPHVNANGSFVAESIDSPARYALRTTAEPFEDAFKYWMQWISGE